MIFDQQADIPVLIVGGGPVGLTMALLLARQNIPSVVVERRPTRADSAPKAHVVNPRSLEILRSLDIDVDMMRSAGPPRGDQEYSRFMTTLAGIELGKIPLDTPEASAVQATPTPLLNLAQPKFEAILRAAAEKNAAIELRTEHDWVGCRLEDGGAISTIQSHGSKYQIKSTFLIAADGANSAVREFLAIPLDGNPSVRPRITIHFEANLRALLRDRPAILYWILDPSVAGTFIAYDIDRTWVYTPRAMPQIFDRAVYTDEHCATLIRNAIGVRDVELQVKHVVPWMMAAQVATAYRRGNCFLVGDAAHRFPPTGGLGLNTGIADAHNLAWKMALALRNAAASAILDSYDEERRPIAENNCRQSLHNSNRLPDLFRLAEQSIIGGTVSDAGRTALGSEISTHREHFLSPGLQLGYSYGPPVRGPAEPTRYDPSANPGDRMPHAWVTHRGRRISTLDLVDPVSFTLFTRTEASRWQGDVVAPYGVKFVNLNDGYVFETDWLKTCGLSGSGAMLVRPDGHVARTVADDTERSRLEIAAALGSWISALVRDNSVAAG
ncbi:MAG: FAD-dependent monooxygenase [Rhizobiales bacterium]|nr:FAD-dependent monooxygenase [Hyphomicrobiales bacterium]